MALYKIKQRLRQWLQGRPNNEEYMRIIDEVNHDAKKLEKLYSVTEMTSWQINCSREMAENLLIGKPQGTFLVRPNSTGKLALSVCCNQKVYHCLIEHDEQGYSFKGLNNSFDTLGDLVFYYAMHSLEECNSCLQTKLIYPVNNMLKHNSE